MEPATLWFERRARRVTRVTSGILLGLGRVQRAATIHSSSDNFTCFALSGQQFPQGVFAVSGESLFACLRDNWAAATHKF